MALTNVAVVEDALALPPADRADLARLLIQSLEGSSLTDDEIRAELKARLEDLLSGKDAGLTFGEAFQEPT